MKIKFAPKIFSNDSIELQNLVLNLLKPHYGLEVALYDYKEFTPEIKNSIKAIDEDKKILHLWQSKVCLKGLRDNLDISWDSLAYEISKAQELGIKKAVIHNNFKSTPLGITDPFEIIKYVQDITPILKSSLSRGLKLHIENTYEDVHFFHTFFDEIIKRDLQQYVGFCLDTGHTRAMTKNSLSDWYDLIKKLNSSGISMHYHIHVNDGTIDSHTTLSQGYQEGLLLPINGWSEEGFLEFFNQLIRLTPDAIFCQEHSSVDALEAISFVEFLQDDGVLPVSV